MTVCSYRGVTFLCGNDGLGPVPDFEKVPQSNTPAMAHSANSSSDMPSTSLST